LQNPNEINRPSASTLFFVLLFDSRRALRQLLSAALLKRRTYIHDIGQGTHGQTISDLLMTREPDGRGLLTQVRRRGSELAPDLTETEAAAWRGITPLASPRHRLTMLPPTRCSSIASSPASQSIRCSQGSASRGHREGSGRATSPTLTVARKRKERRASDRGQKLLPPAVIAPYARKSLSEIVFCKIGQLAVSDPTSVVNSVPQRRPLAPQWDSRARSTKRQHHRCIGCEKRPRSDLSGL
jgi:hypothetical protein